MEKRNYIEGGPYRGGVERGKVAYFGRRMLQNCGILGKNRVKTRNVPLAR